MAAERRRPSLSARHLMFLAVVHAMLDTDPNHDRTDRTEQIDMG